jgi:hypothetical protein
MVIGTLYRRGIEPVRSLFVEAAAMLVTEFVQNIVAPPPGHEQDVIRVRLTTTLLARYQTRLPCLIYQISKHFVVGLLELIPIC